MSKLAIDVKKSNILDMALMFSSMIRLFAKGSKERIARELWDLTSGLAAINSVDDYEHCIESFVIGSVRKFELHKKPSKTGRPSRANTRRLAKLQKYWT